MVLLTDDLEILKNSFAVTANVERLATRVTGQYWQSRENTFAHEVVALDASAETLFGKPYPETLELPWVRDQTTAAHIAARVVAQRHYPILELACAIPVEAFAFDLMDQAQVIHFSGPGDGQFDATITILAVAVDLDGIKVDISGAVTGA